MKQVRYAAAGAIGLAPLVIAAAAAPSAPHAPAGHAKKVSLEVRQAPLTAACYGGTEATAYDYMSTEHFWYTVDSSVTCIGTVEYYENTYEEPGDDMRVRIWGPNLQYQAYVPGSETVSGNYFADAVRNYYGGNFHTVEVCVAMVPQSNKNIIRTGPVCDTVRG
jgi:hypothetical protein